MRNEVLGILDEMRLTPAIVAQIENADPSWWRLLYRITAPTGPAEEMQQSCVALADPYRDGQGPQLEGGSTRPRG